MEKETISRHPSRMTAQEVMAELEENLVALSLSSRYRLGKALGTLARISSLRFRKPGLAMDCMLEIIRKYQSDGKSVSAEQANELIRQIRDLYLAFIESKRWRIGNGLINALERILARKPGPMATVRIGYLLDNYQLIAGRSRRMNQVRSSGARPAYETSGFNKGGAETSRRQIEVDLKHEFDKLVYHLHDTEEKLEEYYLKYQELKNRCQEKE